MAGTRPRAAVARTREELFAELAATHDALQKVQDTHEQTPHRCLRSGACCQVGLQLPLMECEHIADRLRATRTEAELRDIVKALKRAFEDDEWNWASSIGDHMCAFYEDGVGCTIHPFRPGICRMFGPILEPDDFCPRERLANGRGFVFVQPEVDRIVARYYRVLDVYGRQRSDLDHTVYMPAGVLRFLISPEELARLKARTPKKFWRREKGYRTQFVPSYRRGESFRTNVKLGFTVPDAASPR